MHLRNISEHGEYAQMYGGDHHQLYYLLSKMHLCTLILASGDDVVDSDKKNAKPRPHQHQIHPHLVPKG